MSKGPWHSRTVRLTVYALFLIAGLLLIFFSEYLGRLIISSVRDTWYASDVYRQAAVVRQIGTLVGSIFGCGLILESFVQGQHSQAPAAAEAAETAPARSPATQPETAQTSGGQPETAPAPAGPAGEPQGGPAPAQEAPQAQPEQGE